VVSLATDDRARVPFALVGVLLLVGSAAFHASLGATPAVREPANERALERAGAEVAPALRAAVRRAARGAAADPVVTPANTSVGRALDRGQPFRDALRLRAYLAARAALERANTTVGQRRAAASLPSLRSDRTRAVRRAIERVSIRRTGPDGRRLRVTFSNVTIRVRQHGRVVARRSFSPTVTVRSPVLELHERTRRYSRLLDARTLNTSSAAARVTAGSYLLAQSRGTAQWAGAPVANVLANRHVALVTNAAVYDAQQRAFGRPDPEWRRGLGAATRRAVGGDLAHLGFETTKVGRSEPTSATIGAAQRFLVGNSEPVGSASETPDGVATGSDSAPGRSPRSLSDNRTVRIGVNRSADTAFAAMIRREDGSSALARRLRAVYTVDARRLGQSTRIATNRSGEFGPPDGARDWELVTNRTKTNRRFETGTVRGGSPLPVVPERWHVLRAITGEATRVRIVRREWRAGNRTATTTGTVRTRFAVGVAIVGRHETAGHALDRPIEPVHERGGPLDGPNLVGVEDRAVERLVTRAGGPERLVERAHRGTLDTGVVPIRADRPAGLERWVYRDLVGLRERVRNVSVTRSARSVGSFRAQPAAALADRLRDRRPELVGRPQFYRGVAHRARIAVRSRYLDRVIDRLERRAAARSRAKGRLDQSLASKGLPSIDRIGDLRDRASLPRLGSGAHSPRAGVRPGGLVPDGTPTHLTLTDMSRTRAGLGRAGTVQPLAARNTNAFTLPAGDLVDLLGGGQRVPLRTAARTLQAANGTASRTTNATLDRRRRALRRAVAATNDRLRVRAGLTLRRHGVGENRSRRIVRAALSRWPTPTARATAFANGSATRALVRAAEARAPEQFGPGNPVARDRLRMGLRGALRRALTGEAGTVPGEPTEKAGRAVREIAMAGAAEATRSVAAAGARRAKRRLYGSLDNTVPAGLPVLPPVQPWYVTVNVWAIHVRGVHPRFVVRAPAGTGPGPPLAYERDGQAVRLDIDSDGSPERLGRASRLDFDIRTALLVVVPPGGTGVGDVDGNADERSGWPRPDPWPGERAGG
jgi:hypothetical protein